MGNGMALGGPILALSSSIRRAGQALLHQGAVLRYAMGQMGPLVRDPSSSKIDRLGCQEHEANS